MQHAVQTGRCRCDVSLYDLDERLADDERVPSVVTTGSIGLGHLQSGAADKRRKVGKDGRMTGVAADDGQNRLAPFSNVDLPMWLAKTLVKKNMAQVVRLFSRATRACARESCEGGQRCGSSLRFVWRRHRLDVCDVRASCRRDAPRSLRLTLSCASCLHQRGQGATASASARVQLLVECRRVYPAQLCLTLLLLSVLATTRTHTRTRTTTQEFSRSYSDSFRVKLDADPYCVNLRDKSEHYYRIGGDVGTLLARMPRKNEFRKTNIEKVGVFLF